MSKTYQVLPIGHVQCARATPDDDNWDAFPATISLSSEFGADALAGLESFSHVEVLYVFDRVGEVEINTTARFKCVCPQTY